MERESKKFFVVGCGRWGSFIAWYLHEIGHRVSLYGREGSKNMEQLLNSRSNGYVVLPQAVKLTHELNAISDADILILSIGSQNLDTFMESIEKYSLKNKILILCMKGIAIHTGERLSEIVERHVDSSNKVAVWLGPGHVQDFCSGKPNCMVIDSRDEQTKETLIPLLSSRLIRFYYGTDLIGNEIGAALKNVIGIAAGMLDGMGLSSLKGALMARGTSEVGRLIHSLGGKTESAYGLCHLGDYEATLFSKYSHNRMFGENFVQGKPMEKLAEGYYTVQAIMKIKNTVSIEMPICEAVYRVLFENEKPSSAIETLFERNQKQEF